MSAQKFQLKYPCSKFWLIFWLIIFFPVGIVLLLNHLKIISGSHTFSMQYEGSRFWLFFWALIFFPIVVLLFVLNGSFIKKTK